MAKSILRLVAFLLVVQASHIFINALASSLIPLGDYEWIAGYVSLLCAFGVGLYIWSKLETSDHGAISSILLGAILLGSIGFSTGFYGPMVFTPDANMGPIIGILITGPLSFFGGGIVGFLYWAIHNRKRKGNGKNQNSA